MKHKWFLLAVVLNTSAKELVVIIIFISTSIYGLSPLESHRTVRHPGSWVRPLLLGSSQLLRATFSRKMAREVQKRTELCMKRVEKSLLSGEVGLDGERDQGAGPQRIREVGVRGKGGYRGGTSGHCVWAEKQEPTLHGGKIGVCIGQCSMMEKAWALKSKRPEPQSWVFCSLALWLPGCHSY